jgi:hypothetical protein
MKAEVPSGLSVITRNSFFARPDPTAFSTAFYCLAPNTARYDPVEYYADDLVPEDPDWGHWEEDYNNE